MKKLLLTALLLFIASHAFCDKIYLSGNSSLNLKDDNNKGYSLNVTNLNSWELILSFYPENKKGYYLLYIYERDRATGKYRSTSSEVFGKIKTVEHHALTMSFPGEFVLVVVHGVTSPDAATVEKHENALRLKCITANSPERFPFYYNGAALTLLDFKLEPPKYGSLNTEVPTTINIEYKMAAGDPLMTKMATITLYKEDDKMPDSYFEIKKSDFILPGTDMKTATAFSIDHRIESVGRYKAVFHNAGETYMGELIFLIYDDDRYER